MCRGSDAEAYKKILVAIVRVLVCVSRPVCKRIDLTKKMFPSLMKPNDRTQSDSFNLSQIELLMISNRQTNIVCKLLKVSSCRDRLIAGDDIIIRPLSQHDDKWAPGQSIRQCCIFHRSSAWRMEARLDEPVHLTMDDGLLVEYEKISTILGS